MLPNTLLAVALAALPLTISPVAAHPAQVETQSVDVQGVHAIDSGISLVATLHPMPVISLAATSITVQANGADLPSRTSPLLSDRTALEFVMDGSADGAEALAGGGQAGSASFLLQMPPEARTGVVVDREPPSVASQNAAGVSDDVRAASAVAGTGERSTSAAIGLALRQLPAWPGAEPVIVLFTSAPDAGGETTGTLAARLQKAHVVLAVVTTDGGTGYWDQVATATGGLSITSSPKNAIKAFDKVADALQSRYDVTFSRPASGVRQATLKVDRSGTISSAPVGVPAQASPVSARPSSDGGFRWWLWAVILLGLLVFATAVLMIARARTRAHAEGQDGQDVEDLAEGPSPPDPETEPEAEPAESASLPGIRVFEIGEVGDPREITGSLFEPRTLRDARRVTKDKRP